MDFDKYMKYTWNVKKYLFMYPFSGNMEYLRDDNRRYKDVEYWDERYELEHTYDWLSCFSKFQVKKEDSTSNW